MVRFKHSPPAPMYFFTHPSSHRHPRMFSARELASLQAGMTPPVPCLSPRLPLATAREAPDAQTACWRISLKLLVWAYMLAALYAVTVVGFGLSREAMLYPSALVGLLLLLHASNRADVAPWLLPWVVALPFVCACGYLWVHLAACVWLSAVLRCLATGTFHRVSSLLAAGVVAVGLVSVSAGVDRVKHDFIVVFLLIQGLLALFPFHNLSIQVQIDKL